MTNNLFSHNSNINTSKITSYLACCRGRTQVALMVAAGNLAGTQVEQDLGVLASCPQGGPGVKAGTVAC